MDYIDSYQRAKEFFLNKFVPERKILILRLKTLKNKIQDETEIQKVGSVAYSSGGILSGGALLFSLLAAPMTAGVSTAVVVGLYGSVIFGGADITHRLIKGGLTRKWLDEADTAFEAHKITFSNLLGNFLLKLIEDIKAIELKIEFIRQIKCDEEKEIKLVFKHLKEVGMLVDAPPSQEKFLDIMIEKGDVIFELLLSNGLVSRCVSTAAKLIAVSGTKKVAEEVIKESAKDWAKKSVKHGSKHFTKKGVNVGTKSFTKGSAKNCMKHYAKEGAKEGAQFVKAFKVASVGVGIGLDVLSLVYSVKDLARFSDGELCAEAETLSSVIKQMEYELEYLNSWFEEKANEEI